MLQDPLTTHSRTMDAALLRLVSGIPPRPDPAHAPLSHNQTRLWFLWQLEPGNPAHQHGLTLRLSGLLDQAALQRALNFLIARHESLRAAVCVQDGRPALVIHPPAALPLPVLDFSDLNPQIAEARTQAAIQDDSRRAFDLCAAPLLRAMLYRRGHHSHTLYLAAPAFAADAASLYILARELCALYGQIALGKRVSMPVVAAHHPDYAVWQHGQGFHTQAAHLLEQFSGAAGWLPLAGARPGALDRPSGAPWRALSEERALSPALSVALRALAAREDVPLETPLLAAFTWLLYSRTGEACFLVGLPAARRAHSDLAGSVGPYADFAPMRAQLDEAHTFRGCLRGVQAALQAARSAPDVPFACLVSAAKPPPMLGASHPLVQVGFALEDSTPVPVTLPADLRCQVQAVESGASLLDVSLQVFQEKDEGLRARLRCRAHCFDAEAARALLADYIALLELAAADPNLPLAALAGASHAQRPVQPGLRLPFAAPLPPPPTLAHTPLESALAEMWQELLHIAALPDGAPAVGVETSFFDLGGDSLQAVSLLERIRAGWGQKLPLKFFLGAPTVAALAEALHERLAVHASTLIPLQTGGERLPFFCVVAPEKLPALSALARALAPERPVYALQDSAALPHKGGEDEASAARFEAALRAVQPHGPYVLGGVGRGGPAAMLLAHRLQSAGEKVALLALVDSQAPAAPPAVRFAWLRRLLRIRPRRSAYDGPTLLLRSKPRAVLAGDPALGWGRMAASVDVRSVPVARADLLAEAHAATLANILRPALDAAE